MAAVWTDEIRKEMTDAYIEKMEGKDGNESMAIVNEIQSEFANQGQTFTANAIRLMLMAQRRPTEDDAEGIVYIKKPTGAAASSGTSGKSVGTAKISKAEAQKQLSDVISAVNPDLVDSAIIEKLTGKAAQYLTGVILSINGE